MVSNSAKIRNREKIGYVLRSTSSSLAARFFSLDSTLVLLWVAMPYSRKERLSLFGVQPPGFPEISARKDFA
jgi:hypothetical protein